jgi:excisionase family DNA binding protein
MFWRSVLLCFTQGEHMRIRHTQEKPAPKPVMTAKEVAEFLGVSRRHVYELAKTGGLPSFRVGSVPRFYREKIEKLDAAQ